MDQVHRYRLAVVLLTAALLATLTTALTGGDRADAVDGPVETVYVATGRNFPDALAGATLATTVGAPMLTVEPRLPLPQATVDALTALDPNTIIVFGGPGAVPDDVVAALEAHARSGSVTRIAGGDRHETAAMIADALPEPVGPQTTQIVVPLSDVVSDGSNGRRTSGPDAGLPIATGDRFAFSFRVPPTVPVSPDGRVDAHVRMQLTDGAGDCLVDLQRTSIDVFGPDIPPSPVNATFPESLHVDELAHAVNDYPITLQRMRPGLTAFLEFQRMAEPEDDCGEVTPFVSLVAVVVDFSAS